MAWQILGHRLILNQSQPLTGHSPFHIEMERIWIWLRVGPKGTNKAQAPMGFELICQLLTSQKLPLIIFNTTL